MDACFVSEGGDASFDYPPNASFTAGCGCSIGFISGLVLLSNVVPVASESIGELANGVGDDSTGIAKTFGLALVVTLLIISGMWMLPRVCNVISRVYHFIANGEIWMYASNTKWDKCAHCNNKRRHMVLTLKKSDYQDMIDKGL